MIILGINPGYDSTAALLVDGKVAAIVEEERLSRVKNHLGFPVHAIPEVLRIAGVKGSEVDQVTFSFVEYLHANRLLTELLLSPGGIRFDPENRLAVSQLVKEFASVLSAKNLYSLSPAKSSKLNYKHNQQRYVETLNAMGIPVKSILPVDHHLSHAASAYYSSGFDECLLVTADGSGDGLSASVSIGSQGKIRRIHQTPESFSAGLFYGSITSFLGFKAHRHEGKITGLAAYGDPAACYDELIPCLSIDTNTGGFSCRIRDSWLKNTARRIRDAAGKGFYRHPVVNDYHEYFARTLRNYSREDIAAAAQKRLEDVFVEYLAPIIKSTGIKKLGLAGGVFANVKLNQRLFEMTDIEEVYVHPNMGDGGNALGSAYVAFAKGSNQGSRQYMGSALDDVYFGPSYSDREIEVELKNRRLQYTRHEDIEGLTGAKVAEGYIVGRFNGRMEYGPRALGNRTILAHPGNKDINQTLNDRLRRTEFMPFAPSVVAEDVGKYFHVSPGNFKPSEFMTITCNVRKDQAQQIPAVTHIDGTARPHIVKSSVNPSYHRIINAFKARTGLGVVINTSFNIHEEPIVCSPADACRALQENAVDYLSIGKFWVER